MATPIFYPPPRYELAPGRARAKIYRLHELCAAAGVTCRASGDWIRRRVFVRMGGEYDICAQPGYRGDVVVTVPAGKEKPAARQALAALAYGLFDGVAREGIRGAPWAHPTAPPGRPRSGQAKTTAERQRAFRQRQAS